MKLTLQHHEDRTLQQYKVPFITILILGIVVCIGLSLVFSRLEKQRLQNAFDRRANILAQTIQLSLDKHIELLSSTQSLFSAAGNVGRGEFRDYVSRSITPLPFIEAFLWIPKIPERDLSSYEASAKASGVPNFTFKKVENHKTDQFYVYFAEPADLTQSYLGLDLYSLVPQDERNTKSLYQPGSRSFPISRSASPASRDPLWLVLYPVYFQKDGPYRNLRERVRGYVGGVFKLERLIEETLSGVRFSGISISSSRLIERDEMIFTFANESENTKSFTTPELRPFSTTVFLGDERITVELKPTGLFFKQERQYWHWLIVALVFGVMIFLLLHLYSVFRRTSDIQALEERLLQMTENIDEIFWMTDPDKNQMLHVSKAYEKIWGRPLQTLYEQPRSFIESIHPEDRDRVIQMMPTQVQGTYDIEYRVVQPNGDIRWIRDRAFPIRNHDGHIYRVAGVAQDITEIKASIEKNQLLASITSMSVDAITTGDLQGRFTSWNQAAEIIFGFKQEDILGANIFDVFVPPERRDEVKEILSRDPHSPEASYRLRTERLHKSGSRIPVMITSFPLFDHHRKHIGRAGIIQDLRSVIDLETKVMQTERMAAVGQLAASVAHEIRNPLFGISSVAQILATEDHANPETQKLIEAMLSEIERLNKILENLLSYSRPRMLNKSPTNPKKMFDEIAELHSLMLKEKDITLIKDFDTEARTVLLDSDQFRQVFLNLFINAIQASDPKGKIWISSKVDLTKGWSFSLRNQGKIIDASHLQRIFEPFFSTRTGGSGLGLSVTKRIIEDHGGIITCVSNPEIGTEFSFFIPKEAILTLKTFPVEGMA